MNRFAYELSRYTLKYFSGLSNANTKISGAKNIPEGSIIFTANHFTRIETIFLPYHIHNITKKQVWSLAAAELFDVNMLKGLLDNLGAVSTKDPHRDELILKTLLSSNVHWIIFPEGMMVKNKKVIQKDHFVLKDDKAVSRPHTGAAILAMRCEFYRERLRRMKKLDTTEFERLQKEFGIDEIDKVLNEKTYIVPVNITYYPANSRTNILSKIAGLIMKEPSKRVMDELMTEGSKLFTNVDINITFGKPIEIHPYLNDPYIESMLTIKRKIKFDNDLCSKQIVKKSSVEIMKTYMSAVYNMTCINYDHVMAVILKHFPYKRDGIDIYEFRCKVFFAISWLVSNRKYVVSKNFQNNQIHLLTNDDYKRFEGFFQIAQDTTVIEIKNDKIFKDQTKFITKSDFHTIRIDNPVLVMANEIEPLREVEDFLKKTAQKSMEEIQKDVKKKILEKIHIDFTKDYNDYYIEEESKKKRIGRPLFLKHQEETTGILLIHGYMAAPEEMKSFARYLHEKSFTVYVPRLKGHGTSPDDLAQTKFDQWIESVEEGFVILRHSCKKVVAGGFSTGAGLALELSTRVDDVNAVFAVAPPVQLKDLGSYFVPAIDAWNTILKKINLDSMAKEFIENNPENPHINYTRNPIAGIYELEKLMEQLEAKLKTIKTPTLVVQSRKDPVVNPSGTLKLFNELGSDCKEYYIFDYDRHGIMTGQGVERIYMAIEQFIRDHIRDHIRGQA
jgi:esterase/lipase/1-acyl-sn-glycerol-3-phosphate acyltransferase